MPGLHFIDTNVIIRYVTRDDAELSRRAAEYLEGSVQPGGERKITESVLLECVQVLTSPRVYAIPREQVAEILTDVVSLPGLTLADRQVYIDALEDFGSKRVDFADALLAAHSRRAGGTVVSFDRDFDRLNGVVRREP